MLEKGFYLKFSDPPFNISSLSQRIKSSSIWNTTKPDANGTSESKQQASADNCNSKSSKRVENGETYPTISTESLGDHERLLLDAIRSCKLLHRNQIFDETKKYKSSKIRRIIDPDIKFLRSANDETFSINGPVIPLYSNMRSASLADIGYEKLSKYLDPQLIHSAEHGTKDKSKEKSNNTFIDTKGSKSSLVADLRKAFNKPNNKSKNNGQRFPKGDKGVENKLSRKPNEDHEFRQSKPLDLLQQVMDRNSHTMTAAVLYAYMTTAPYPPTSHIIKLLKEFKSSLWIQPTTFQLLNGSPLNGGSIIPDSSLTTASKEIQDYQEYRQNVFVKMITKLGSFEKYKYADPLSEQDSMSPRQLRLTERIYKLTYKDTLTLTDLCWISLRNSVYRQEFDEAFQIVDIATKPIPNNHNPDFEQKDSQVLKCPPSGLNLSIGQKTNLVISQLSRSPSRQLELSSSFLFGSFSFLYFFIYYWPHFSSTPILMDESEPLFTAIADASDMNLSSYTSLPGSLVLSTILSFIPPMIYFTSFGGSFIPFSLRGINSSKALATQRVRWSSATLWQQLFPTFMKNGSFVFRVYRGFKQLLNIVMAPLKILLARIVKTPNSQADKTKLESHSAAFTNMQYEGLTELDRAVLELKMVDYITVSFDEIVDVTVDNYHLFGENVSDTEMVGSFGNLVDDASTIVEPNEQNQPDAQEPNSVVYPASAIDMTTKEILPLKQVPTSFAENSELTGSRATKNDDKATKSQYSRKGPSIAQSRAQVLLTEQLAKRNMRIKDTVQERWFNEYWAMAGEGYVWVEPDQDPSTGILRKLRYGQK